MVFGPIYRPCIKHNDRWKLLKNSFLVPTGMIGLHPKLQADPAAASCLPTCAPHGRYDPASAVKVFFLKVYLKSCDGKLSTV
jgi:hypothetical protein